MCSPANCRDCGKATYPVVAPTSIRCSPACPSAIAVRATAEAGEAHPVRLGAAQIADTAGGRCRGARRQTHRDMLAA